MPASLLTQYRTPQMRAIILRQNYSIPKFFSKKQNVSRETDIFYNICFIKIFKPNNFFLYAMLHVKHCKNHYGPARAVRELLLWIIQEDLFETLIVKAL